MDAVRRAGFDRGYRRVWGADKFQPYDYRTVTGWAVLFRTSAGAKEGLAAMATDLEKHAPSGDVVRWHEFGDESVGAVDTGKRPSAAYLWRVGNVLLVASTDCGGVQCKFADLEPVEHAYARELDSRARNKS